MRQFYLFALAAVCGLQANAALPFQRGITPPPTSQAPASAPALRAPETYVLFEEDFSRFTAGSEDAPAPCITDNGNYRIPESMTAQPGWTGNGVYPAGGCIVLKPWKIDETSTRGGNITTPQALMNGTATLTFRAKKFGTEPAQMWIAVCSDYYGPGEDQDHFPLTDEWQTYTFVATHADLEVNSYIQIMAEQGCAVIDDVKVMFCQDRIKTPQAREAINLSPTAFRASWGEVKGAEGYLLTVECTEQPKVVETGEILEDFEGLNLSDDGKKIDTSNPGYPDGWSIDVSTNGSQDATTDPSEVGSGTKAIFFDAVGDFIETADAPLPLDGLSFYAKPIGEDETDYFYMSLIKVEIYYSKTDTWDHVANLYYADFGPDGNGGVYTLDEQNFTDDVTRIRLSMIQEGTKKFVIDDIKLHYRTRGTVSKLLDDVRVKSTLYDVNDINPANDYVYYVKSYLGDVISEPSYPKWVDGIAGLKVSAYEPYDLTTTSFTAAWEPLGHATDYTISLNRLVAPEENLEDVVVLEENFDGITQGTVENPGTQWNSPKDFSAEGWTKVSWSATQPAWAEGMIGTTGTSPWFGTAGLIFTPTLDLSCYDGNGITVEGSFVTTVSEFEGLDGTENEGIFAMLMNSHTDQQPIAYGYLDTPVAGPNSGTIVISNVPDDAYLPSVIIAFMDKSGQTFFVDDVKITMNVPAGKTLITPLDAIKVQTTEHTLQNLDPTFDYAYTIVGSASRNFYNYTSLPSDMMFAKTSSSAIGEIEADSIEAEAEYFNLQGIAVPADALVPGIYIERRGSVSRKVIKR